MTYLALLAASGTTDLLCWAAAIGQFIETLGPIRAAWLVT